MKNQSGDALVCHSGFDRDLAPNIAWGPITRDVYIFECNTSGEGSVIINGREFPVKPRDCYILLPGDTIVHTTGAVPRRGAWIAATGDAVGEALREAGITSLSPYAPRELFDLLTSEVLAIANMQDETDSGADFRRRGHLFSFLGILLGATNPQRRTDSVTQAIGYMETHYNEPISVSDLAAAARLERSYFSVRFKEATGLSPHTYLCSLRIRKAQSLMIKTGCSVSEAAEYVGLDARNFSRLFRREVGMTPLEYLKKERE